MTTEEQKELLQRIQDAEGIQILDFASRMLALAVHKLDAEEQDELIIKILTATVIQTVAVLALLKRLR